MPQGLLRRLYTLLLAALAATAAVADEKRSISLTIGEHHILAEVADTPALRQRGLMERAVLPETAGMLFVFSGRPRTRCFWMRNTYIPLDIAFIDQNGHIMQIRSMEPLSERTHCSARPATYALEVSRRWFARRGLGPGSRIEGLNDLKTAAD